MQQQFDNDNTIVVTHDGCFGDKKSVLMLAIEKLMARFRFLIKIEVHPVYSAYNK